MTLLGTPVTVELRDANDDAELSAISKIASILNVFDDRARERIVTYLCGRYPIMGIKLVSDGDGETGSKDAK